MDIARRQQQRLSDLVAYARTYSPYYRRLLAICPEPVSNISRLPVVTKAELMSQFGSVGDRSSGSVSLRSSRQGWLSEAYVAVGTRYDETSSRTPGKLAGVLLTGR